MMRNRIWTSVSIGAAALTFVSHASAATWPDGRPDLVPHAPASPPGWISRWDVYYGGFRQLDELAVRSDGWGWGVDVALADRVDHSVFTRFGPGEVRALQSEANVAVRALVLSATGGWAVGDSADRGIVYALSLDRWVRVAGAAAPLHAVALSPADPGRGWAVGDRGTVLVLGADGWSNEVFPDRLARLRAVAALGADEAWALEEAGWLWHRTVDGWQRLDEPRVQSPLAMAFSAGGHGLVLGSSALAYVDGTWSSIAAPGRRATSVAWVGTAAFAAVDGGVSRWNGQSWTALTMPTTPVFIETVEQIAASGRGWVASDREGAIVTGDPTPTVLWPVIGALEDVDAHLDGSAWAAGTSFGAGLIGSTPRAGAWDLTLAMPVGSGFSGVSLLSADEGWAVGATFAGREARTAMWHLTPSGWNATSLGPDWGLSSVETLAANDAWASGAGSAARWNGDVWKLVEGAPFGGLTGPLDMVQGGADPEGWFAARGGVYHLQDDVWRLVDLAVGLPSTGELTNLAADPAGGVWALAPEHVIRIASDETVELIPDPPATELRDLSVSQEGAVWLLAEPEGLLRWNTEALSWESHSLGVAGNRVGPTRIQALDHDLDPSLPPPDGWEGHDVWIAGTSAVARFRVVKPSYQAFLPNALRGGRLTR